MLLERRDASSVAQWSARVWSTTDMQALLSLFLSALDAIIPVDFVYGHKDPNLELMVVHALIALTVLELGIVMRRAATPGHRCPRWACRLARLLHPGWAEGIAGRDPLLLTFFRLLVEGSGTALAEGGVVYALYSKQMS